MYIETISSNTKKTKDGNFKQEQYHKATKFESTMQKNYRIIKEWTGKTTKLQHKISNLKTRLANAE